ncbi:MAG: YraN family protein [Myxococcota bacterium]
MTNPRQELGQAGEIAAADFLEARGYRIVARNVRADRVEIDLIARHGSALIFVEVKSRRAQQGGGGHGIAAEAVDERKQRRLRRGAHAWLAAHPVEARRAPGRRFDVVTCLLLRPAAIEASQTKKKTTVPKMARWSIEHWQAAF